MVCLLGTLFLFKPRGDFHSPTMKGPGSEKVWPKIDPKKRLLQTGRCLEGCKTRKYECREVV